MNLNNLIKTNVSKFIRTQAQIEHYVKESLNNDSGIELSSLLTQNLLDNELHKNNIILEIIRKINCKSMKYIIKS